MALSLTTTDIIARMGDRISDRELGVPAGTVEQTADWLRTTLSQTEYEQMDDEDWRQAVLEAILDAIHVAA